MPSRQQDRPSRAPAARRPEHGVARRGAPSRIRRLGGYVTPAGDRDVLALPGCDGSTLLVDCLSAPMRDARLIAHISGDEPARNARLMCALYLADPTRGRCRPLTASDLLAPPCPDPLADPQIACSRQRTLLDPCGGVFVIRAVQIGERGSELRWTRAAGGDPATGFEALALRDVVARLEDYEPARTMTALTLASFAQTPQVCTRRLRQELCRLYRSPIVLNRGLREAVQGAVAAGLSMSEIAMRCGRMKRHGAGGTGETSWLARRIGLMPEGGQPEPTPWIHSDTLALIAREGLAISPHEVEL
jgi:hypothetical protein